MVYTFGFYIVRFDEEFPIVSRPVIHYHLFETKPRLSVWIPFLLMFLLKEAVYLAGFIFFVKMVASHLKEANCSPYDLTCIQLYALVPCTLPGQ